MATKNIYVSETDQALYDRATELAGGLSAAVTAGLRLYVQRKERSMKKIHELELEVDDGPIRVTKRFQGMRLLRYELKEKLRTQTFEIYETAKGQYAAYVRDEPRWSALSGGDGDAVWNDPQTWDPGFYSSGSRTLLIFPDIAAMSSKLPEVVIEAIRAAEATPDIEELDI